MAGTGLVAAARLGLLLLPTDVFFPTLIAGPFHTGLVIAFVVAISLTLLAAAASLAGGRRYVHGDEAAPGIRTPAAGLPPAPAGSAGTTAGSGATRAAGRIPIETARARAGAP